MNEIFLSIAKGLEQAAAGYRRLAENQKEVSKNEPKPEPQVAAEAPKQVPEVSIEDVRAVLAAKSQDGKTKEVRELLLKFDAGRLSEVKPENYPALLEAAKTL